MKKMDKKVWEKPLINDLSIKNITLNGTTPGIGEMMSKYGTNSPKPGGGAAGES